MTGTSAPGLTLVTGGTGKTGHRVADRLRSLGRPVRVAARSTDPAFDWWSPDTWPAVLDGVEHCYLAFSPDLTVPGAVETVGSFAERAVHAGTRRLVLLSGRGVPEAQRAEQVVAGAGAEWTVVRASWFAQNFSEHFLLPAVLDGVITLPVAPGITEPFVDLDDVADVAVTALTGPGHDRQIYEVTGSRLLTFDDVASELSRATGRAIRFASVSPEAFARDARRYGVPADEVDVLVHLFVEILDGHNSFLADGVRRALGRPPRDFAQYAEEAAATGVWKVAEDHR